MILGFVMTGLNIAFNVVLIRGLGPIPSYGTAGAAMGTALASGLVAAYAIVRLWRGGWVVRFPRGQGFGPDWAIIRELFRFGLPAGFQGIAMNIGGVFLLAFVGLARAERACAGSVLGVLQPALLVRHVDVDRPHGRRLRGGGPEPGRRPAGPDGGGRAHRGADRASPVPPCVGLLFFFIPRQLLAIFGIQRPGRRPHRRGAAAGPERVGPLHFRGADLYRRAPGHG